MAPYGIEENKFDLDNFDELSGGTDAEQRHILCMYIDIVQASYDTFHCSSCYCFLQRIFAVRQLM